MPQKLPLYTRSAFTTFLAEIDPYGQGAGIVALSRHISRLVGDIEELGIPNGQTPEELKTFLENKLKQALKAESLTCSHAKPLRVKLSVTEQGPEIAISEYISPWENLSGIRACSYKGERQFPHIKSLDQELCFNARKYAEANSCQEALLVDEEGRIREGAWSNIFWFDQGGQLCTVGSKILLGITRALVLELRPCEFMEVNSQSFSKVAAEAFVTQSTTGITALVMLDGMPIGSGERGPQVQELQQEFNANIRRFEEILLYD